MSLAEKTRFPRVFDYFEELSRIPRGSGHTKAASDFCVAFAREHGLPCRQDPAHNVIIEKAAGPGRQDRPAVMLQGHLDMVAAKEEGCDFDFTRDGLRLRRDGDFLSAEGTTLGGDDGIAVAMALAILEDETLAHPPLEVVFTVDEEIGMLGASALDLSDRKAKSLINLDCEEEGVLTVGCAGGSRVRLTFPAPGRDVHGLVCRIRVGGLIGGHSGVEIHKNRVNANHLLARVLSRAEALCPCPVAGLSGGSADNAIPAEAAAVLVVKEEDRPAVDTLLNLIKIELAEEIGAAEPDFTLNVRWEEEPESRPASEEIIGLLPLFSELPDGVQAMSEELPGLVETSLNLGTMNWDGQTLTLTLSVRSSKGDCRAALEENLAALAERFGGTAAVDGIYPGWPAQPHSRLVHLASDVWRDLTGEEMRVEAIHAGLECGVFLSKMPDLEIIALGPNMQDIHTTKERLSISSTERVYAFVRELLTRL